MEACTPAGDVVVMGRWLDMFAGLRERDRRVETDLLFRNVFVTSLADVARVAVRNAYTVPVDAVRESGAPNLGTIRRRGPARQRLFANLLLDFGGIGSRNTECLSRRGIVVAQQILEARRRGLAAGAALGDVLFNRAKRKLLSRTHETR